MGGIKLGFKKIIETLRYRFFLLAGMFPYLLGQTLAFYTQKSLDWSKFWLGFWGVGLVLGGVELFNEYFDAKEGGDRIFLEEKFTVPTRFFSLGLLAFVLAFFIGVYLAWPVGWPILLFSVLGFAAAYFYVGPPIRWAYRGLGEAVIALSYGPLIVWGSYYLQTRRLDSLPLMVSLILGLSIFALAIVNEIPDYFQDKLVGKRNMVVRLGRRNSVTLFSLSLLAIFICLGLGMGLKIIPLPGLGVFLLLPLVLRSVQLAWRHYDSPLYFLPAIRTILLTYIIINLFLGISYLGG